MLKDHHSKFLGSGTVGEKGQIVIPAEARDKLSIKNGDKLIFFSHGQLLHLIKADELDSVLDRFAARFEKLNHLRDKIKEELK